MDISWTSGEIWVAAHGGGLVRIDSTGNQSWVYHKTNSNCPTVFFTSIEPDTGTCIWAGTDDNKCGLVWFDGENTWKCYNTQNSAIPDNSVRSLLRDNGGKLWVGTDHGIASINNGAWTVFSGSFFSNVNDIVEDKAGNIWAACRGSGIAGFSGGSWTFYSAVNTGLPNLPFIKDITVDTLGMVWGICGPCNSADSGCIVFYNGLSWDLFQLVSPDCNMTFYTESIEADKQGNIWFGKEYNVFAQGANCYEAGYFNQDTLTFTNTPLNEIQQCYKTVRFLKADPNGSMWAMGNGLASFDESNGQWKDYSPLLISSVASCGTGSLKLNPVNGNIYATYGNFIVYPSGPPYGNFSGGLHGFGCYNGFSWMNYNHLNSTLTNDNVVGQCHDNTGNFWITTRPAYCFPYQTPKHIFSFNGVQFTDYVYASAPVLSWESIGSICNDDTGQIWAMSEMHIFKYNGVSWQSLPIQNNNGTPLQCRTFKDSYGNIWIADQFSISLVSIGNGNIQSYTTANSALPSGPTDITEDSAHNLWVSTVNGGIVRIIDPQNWIVYNTSNSAIPTNKITSVAIDSSGKLWMGTWGFGLISWDGSNGWNNYSGWTSYTSDTTGLTSNWISSLLVDKQNNLWVGNHLGGLSVMNNPLTTGNQTHEKNSDLSLAQNFPNPFSSETVITFMIPKPGQLKLMVIDPFGRMLRELADGFFPSGEHKLSWNGITANGEKLPQGVYFYSLQYGNQRIVKPLVLVR